MRQILVVDDSATMRRMVMASLRNARRLFASLAERLQCLAPVLG